MKFEWDPIKEKANVRKHKVAFSEAAYVFADRYALNMFDEGHSEDEDRWVTIGQTLSGKILTIVHTYRKPENGERIRIISAREATKTEARQYLEGRNRQ